MNIKMRNWKREFEEIDAEMNELLNRIAALTSENTALRQENMRLSGECHDLHATKKNLVELVKDFEALTGITKLFKKT